MHRVFISFHHANDQEYKDALVKCAEEKNVFIDGSVDTGDIPDDWDDQKIREYIRDEYLRDTTVTILLVGAETKYRKHVDWELYSSMIDGKKNRKSGVLVILLPSAKSSYFTAAHGTKEKETIYPGQKNWVNISDRSEYEKRYPYMPDRIIDNLLNNEAKISVTNWEDLTPDKLRELIEFTFQDKENCTYDLSRPMRRRDE